MAWQQILTRAKREQAQRRWWLTTSTQKQRQPTHIPFAAPTSINAHIIHNALQNSKLAAIKNSSGRSLSLVMALSAQNHWPLAEKGQKKACVLR
jgi:hypothetical protein